MKWTGQAARRAPKAAARTLALAGVLAASGIAAGTASAAGGDQAPASNSVAMALAYRCHFPSGPRTARVTVAASLPGTGKTGQPIQPTGMRLTIALPQGAVSDLARLGSTTVSAAARLRIDATDGPSGMSVLWPGASRRAARVPPRGGVVLRTSGRVPSLTPSLPGDVMFTAAGLSLTLSPSKASTTPGSPPTPVPAPGPNQVTATSAPSAGTALRVPCQLAKGQQAVLATVTVTGAVARRSLHAAAVTLCPGFPKNGLKLNPRFPPPKPPVPIKPTSAPEPGCAFTTGYADARKLQGAALLQPGLTYVDLFVRDQIDFDPKVNYAQFDNAAQLNFHGLHEFPPSTATFLTFGFVPTTATIALIEHGTINIFAVGPANKTFCKPQQPCDVVATVASRLSVRILPGSVKVNGVPLDVGTQCESAPFDAIVTGNDGSKPPYIVTTGGPLTGLVNIPKFSHCGVGEDLDPIFNAAISGPRNFNLLTQGKVCFVLGGGTCDEKTGLPVPPVPLRKVIG